MRLKFVFGALLLAGLAPSAQAQIVNGGFEIPVLPAGGLQDFTTAGQGLPGWTVVGNDVLLLQTTYAEPGNGVTFNAGQGLNALDITGIGNSGLSDGVSQIVTTVLNQAYVLQFLVGRAQSSTGNASYNSPATVRLVINGGAPTPFTNSNITLGSVNWQSFSTTFTATSTSTNITFLNGSNFIPNYVGLDGITLTAVPPASVPEPGPIALAAVGLPFMAGFGWLRRRKARAAA